MADNYLEKKYEEFRQGRPVLRRNTPSLDSLLKKLQEEGCEADPDYVVKKAQLDALTRSAGFVGDIPEIDTFESAPGDGPSFLKIGLCDDPLLLGEIILAVRLKAAELGLCSKVEFDKCCFIFFFRKRLA